MFSLSFLNSGILFLTSAVIIPILIYLFARKKPQKIIFSTIRFIKESQQQQKKKINIKNLLLLIIRMLIILLTILAISRPTLKLPFLNKGTLHPKTAIAIIIDNSYSMDYLVDTQTEMDKAKNIAQEINEIITNDDLTLLYTLNKDWNNLNGNLNFGKMPEKLIRNISITPLAQPLTDILSDVTKKLKESHLPNKEIYFITDFQKQKIPEINEIPVFVIPTSDALNRNNISCQNANLINELTSRKISRKIEFEVVNHSNFEQLDNICQLFFNGRTIAEKVIDLQAGQRKKEYFRIELEKSGWFSGYVQIRNERLSYDNRNYFSFYYDLSPKVAVITDNFEIPLPLQTILEIYTNDLLNIELIDSENINSEILEQYENVIIYDKTEISEKLKFSIEKAFKNNTGFLFITGQNLSVDWQNFLSEHFNITFEKFRTSKSKIDYINKFHPISGLLEISEKIDLYNYWEIKDNETSIILLQTKNSPLALQKKNSCLWLFDPASYQNTFFLDAAFPVFAYNTLMHNSNRFSMNSTFVVGDKLKLFSEQLELPSGNQIRSNMSYFLMNEQGIYKQNEQLIAVNLDYLESEFERFAGGDQKNIYFLGADWKDNILQTRYGFEIWKHLLIFVLILFALEMLIIKREEKK